MIIAPTWGMGLQHARATFYFHFSTGRVPKSMMSVPRNFAPSKYSILAFTPFFMISLSRISSLLAVQSNCMPLAFPPNILFVFDSYKINFYGKIILRRKIKILHNLSGQKSLWPKAIFFLFRKHICSKRNLKYGI